MSYALPVFAVIFFIATVYGVILGVGYVPCNRALVRRMIEMAKIKPGETVYDLGSGDGRIVFAASKITGNSFGVEGSPVIYLYALLKQKLLRQGGRIIFGNIFSQDLKKADVIFCFLNKPMMEKLAKKFKLELKSGCRIVSRCYELPGWAAKEAYLNPGPGKKWGDVFIYVV